MRRRPFRHRTRIRVGERKPRAINISPPRFFAIFLSKERARDRGSRRVAGMRRRAPRATAQVLLRSPSRPFLGESTESKRFEPAEAKRSGAPWRSRFAVALFRTGRPSFGKNLGVLTLGARSTEPVVKQSKAASSRATHSSPGTVAPFPPAGTVRLVLQAPCESGLVGIALLEGGASKCDAARRSGKEEDGGGAEC
jgi:hypothetical protein